MKHRPIIAIFAALFVLNAGGLHAQTTYDPIHRSEEASIRPTGARAHLGVVVPGKADTGLLYGFTADLGSVWKPWLKLKSGLSRWSADMDPAEFGGRAGTLSDLKLYTSLGVEFWEVSGVKGYLDLGLGTHFLGADIPGDPVLEDAVGGTNVGAEIAYGLATTTGALRLTAEVRREFVDDANNWSFVFGVGSRWGR